jgi:hypothetical protein
MSSNLGVSWSLRMALVLAVAAAIWAGAATVALGALRARAVSANSSVPAPPVPHR